MKVREYFYKSIVFSLILNIVVFYTFAGRGGKDKKDDKKKYSCKGNRNSNGNENSDANHDENDKENNDENKKKAEEQQLKQRIADIKNKFGFAKGIDSNFQDNIIENLDNVKTLTELDDLLKQGTDIDKKIVEAEATINKKKNELQNKINGLKGTYNKIFTELHLDKFEIKPKDFHLSLDNFNEVDDLNNINKKLDNLNKEIDGIKKDFAQFFIEEIKNIIETKEGFDLRDFEILLKNEIPNIVNLIEKSELKINKITVKALDLKDMFDEKFSKIICLEIKKNEAGDKIILFSRLTEYDLSDNSIDKFTVYEHDNNVDNIERLTYTDDNGATKFKKIYFRNNGIDIQKNQTFISYIYKDEGYDGFKFFFIIRLTEKVENDDELIKLYKFSQNASEIAVVDSCKETDSFKCLFENLYSLEQIDFTNFKTECYGSLEGMFSRCSALKSLDLSNINTCRVINMEGMFNGCSVLESLDLSKFDTSRVTSMACMFFKCEKLKNLDLSKFNISKVTDMDYMFNGCSALESLNLFNFNTDLVEYKTEVFAACDNLKVENIIGPDGIKQIFSDTKS